MIIDFDHCRTHADSVLHSVHSKQYQLLKRELLVAYGEMIGSSDSEKGGERNGLMTVPLENVIGKGCSHLMPFPPHFAIINHAFSQPW